MTPHQIQKRRSREDMRGNINITNLVNDHFCWFCCLFRGLKNGRREWNKEERWSGWWWKIRVEVGEGQHFLCELNSISTILGSGLLYRARSGRLAQTNTSVEYQISDVSFLQPHILKHNCQPTHLLYPTVIWQLMSQWRISIFAPFGHPWLAINRHSLLKIRCQHVDLFTFLAQARLVASFSCSPVSILDHLRWWVRVCLIYLVEQRNSMNAGW